MIRVNVNDSNHLRTLIEAFKEGNNDEFPNQKSGAVRGVDDTWAAVNFRLGKLTPPSSLAQEVSKIDGVKSGTKVDVSNLDELRLHLEEFKAAYGKYPSSNSGDIVGTGDTWLAVDARLRKEDVPTSLSQLATAINGAIKGTDDTWAALNHRLNHLPRPKM